MISIVYVCGHLGLGIDLFFSGFSSNYPNWQYLRLGFDITVMMVIIVSQEALSFFCFYPETYVTYEVFSYLWLSDKCFTKVSG